MQKKTKKAKRITVQMNVRTGLKNGGCISDSDCDSGWVCRSGVCRRPCDTRADCPPGEICVDNDYCMQIF